MRHLGPLVLLSACFGASDDVKIGKATGAYRKWDTAKCTCELRTDGYFGPIVQLGCAPMFTGEASTSLALGMPWSRNTVERVLVADYFDESASGYALVEVSSETDEELGTPVWIDQLVMFPHSCDGGGTYYYYSDVCEEFKGGTLENVRMYCQGTP